MPLPDLSGLASTSLLQPIPTPSSINPSQIRPAVKDRKVIYPNSEAPPPEPVSLEPDSLKEPSEVHTFLQQANSVAEFLAAKEDYITAIKYYEKITDLDPENGIVWTALGHCYLVVNEYSKAFSAYQKAMQCLPDSNDPQLWYGVSLLYDKVCQDLNKVSLKPLSTQYPV